MIDVSIIIPVFGDEKYLMACLNALESNLGTPGGNLAEVICVDNATGYDIKVDAVIHNSTNLGFAKACNEGANVAHGQYLFFLNVDTEVQPGWLEPLVAAMSDEAVAMCGPRIVHPDGSLQTASGIRTWHGDGCAGGEELKIDGPSCDADGVTGAAMMIRRDVFWAAGGFCDLYDLGYEDVDLCLTVREMGWRVRFVAESTIVHHESATGPERWRSAHANVALMNQRWGNR